MSDTTREVIFTAGPEAMSLHEFRRLYTEALDSTDDELLAGAVVTFDGGLCIYCDRPLTADEIELRETGAT